MVVLFVVHWQKSCGCEVLHNKIFETLVMATFSTALLFTVSMCLSMTVLSISLSDSIVSNVSGQLVWSSITEQTTKLLSMQKRQGTE